MCGVDSKGDGADGIVVGGGYSLGQRVLAVIQTGQCKLSFARVDGHSLDNFRATINLFGQSELCTFQRMIVLIDLVHNHLVGKDDDVIPRSFARAVTARVVGVLQLCLVDVAVCAQNSVLVQLRLVGNGNDRISSNTSDFFQIIKYDLKGAVIVRRSTVFFGKDLIIGIRDYLTVFIAEIDFHSAGVKGQTLFFLIVESVVILAIGIIVCGNSALQAEGDVIADIIVGRILPVRNIAGRIVSVLQLFLKFGNSTALRIDGNIANNGNEVSGIRLRARQRTILVLDQVVTANNFNRTAVCNDSYRSSVKLDIIFDNVKLSFVACTGSNGGKCIQNILLNSCANRTSAVFAPLDVGKLSSTGCIGTIITGEDLVDLVDVGGSRCGDRVPGNSSSAGRAAAICRKRRDSHGANHSNCQQRSHEFLHCFFHGKSPFLFSAPCPPAFCRGVVLFGLSRKLCAGRAGFKLRASGREVQFSHLPSLRVCACGG